MLSVNIGWDECFGLDGYDSPNMKSFVRSSRPASIRLPGVWSTGYDWDKPLHRDDYDFGDFDDDIIRTPASTGPTVSRGMKNCTTGWLLSGRWHALRRRYRQAVRRVRDLTQGFDVSHIEVG
jgi:hypothetical protein